MNTLNKNLEEQRELQAQLEAELRQTMPGTQAHDQLLRDLGACLADQLLLSLGFSLEELYLHLN